MGIKYKLKNKYLNNEQFRRVTNKLFYLVKGNSKKIKGHSNTIEIDEALVSNTEINILGSYNKIKFKKGTKLNNLKIIIIGDNHNLTIGENCIIKSGVLWFEDYNCTIFIGANTTIEDVHIAATEPYSNIIIGEDCMLSSGIDIRNGDSHSIFDLSSDKRINFAKDIKIENHVWIGAHVQILKGVRIGKDSVVGVRSLVTKDISGNSVAVGIPAKVIKENINWDRKRIYN